MAVGFGVQKPGVLSKGPIRSSLVTKRVSLEEFEQGYADRSGVTVEWLRTNGQRVAPCDCDYKGCKGWQMQGHFPLEKDL